MRQKELKSLKKAKVYDLSSFVQREQSKGHIEIVATGVGSSYIEYMKSSLSSGDYIDFLEACLDKKAYEQAEDEIKALVDKYYE